MIFVIICTVIMALLGILVYGFFVKPNIKTAEQKTNISIYFVLIAAAAGIIRIIVSGVYSGPSVENFIGTADSVFRNSLSEAYASESALSPIGMYILWLTGAVKTAVSNKAVIKIFIAIPSILCDIAAGCIIYNASKKRFSQNISLIISGFYLFNPAAIADCVMPGRFNSIFALALLASVMLISNKKLIYSYIAFIAAALVNRQALMFLPIVLFAAGEQLFSEKKISECVKNVISAVVSLMAGVILIMPLGVDNFIAKYTFPLRMYSNELVNKLNIWVAYTQIWNVNVSSVSASSAAEFIFILFSVVLSVFILFKSKNPGKYYFAAGVTAVTYIFSVKMHEIYIFPAMAMFLMAYIMAPSTKLFGAYWFMTSMQFFYELYIIFGSASSNNKLLAHPLIIALVYVNIAFFFYLIYNIEKIYIQKIPKCDTEHKEAENVRAVVEKSAVFPEITKKDMIFMAIVMVIYGAVALYNLGNTFSPQSEYLFKNKDDFVLIDLGEDDVEVKEVKSFLGEGAYDMEGSSGGNVKGYTVGMSNNPDFQADRKLPWVMNSFFWISVEINESGRYFKIKADTDNVRIREMALIGKNGEILTPVNTDEFPELFDEQQYIPDKLSMQNSMYFDECFHARTAYDYLNGLHVYEKTHPPLGKDIIALGIKLFGMNPFGWRFCGAIFGIIMIPVIYIMAKNISKTSYAAGIAAILLSADFMHFTQSRVGVVDVYLVTFIMLMYYFMYKYYNTSFYDTPFKKTLVPLALSGIFMGLAVSTKWNGVFACVGLAAVFFITYIKRYREYLYAKKDTEGETNGISHKYITDNYKKYARQTIGYCCIFFIAVPLLIYCLSYIPYINTEGMSGFKSIIENQGYILNFHGDTVVGIANRSQSKWYTWLSIRHQFLYHLREHELNNAEVVCAFGNPAVWWGGVLALYYVLYAAIRKKDRTALFIIIGYLSQIICWIFVKRNSFIYHYFPAVPFLILAVAYTVNGLCRRYSEVKFGRISVSKMAVGIYAGIAVILFIMFYPIISGHEINMDFMKDWLIWFETWVFV